MQKKIYLKNLKFWLALALVFLQIVSSTEIALSAPEKILAEVALQLNPSEFPSAMGSIEETFKGKQASQVVIIKDAHAVPDAQHSIANILEYLENQHHLNWVGAEGASGLFQTELFKTFPDSALLKKTLDALTAQGELSGAAIAALTGGDRVVFEGLEDAELYQSQLDAYFRAKQKRAALEALLQEFETQIQAAKIQFYSPAARNWDALLTALEADQPDPNAWLQTLNEIKKAIPELKQKYPVLYAAWSEFRHQEATTNEAGMALKAFKKEIEQKNPKTAQDSLWNQRAQAWMTGSMSDTQYAAYLEADAARAGLVALPAPIKKLADIGRLMTQVRSSRWVSEWHHALQDAGQIFFLGEREKEVAEMSRRLTALQNAAKLELAPKDWLEIKAADARTGTSQDLSLKQLMARLEDLRDAVLGADCAQFYEIAAKRDVAFIQKIETAALSGKKNRAIVVGGFHALALAEALRKKNISYAVVMPAIQNIGDKEIYAKLMQGDVSWKKFFKIKDGRIQVYESFASAMIHQLLNLEDYRKDPKQVLPYFKDWRTQLVRRVFIPEHFNAALEALNLLDEETLHAYYGAEFSNWKEKASGVAPLPVTFDNPRALFKSATGLMAQAWTTTPLGSLEIKPDSTREGVSREGEPSGSRPSVNDLYGRLNLQTPKTPNEPDTPTLLLYKALYQSSTDAVQQLGKEITKYATNEKLHDFQKNLAEIANWDKDYIYKIFTPEVRKSIMTLIFLVAPQEVFKRTQEWHNDYHDKLEKFRAENAEFFEGGVRPQVLFSFNQAALGFAFKSLKNPDKVFVATMVFSVNRGSSVVERREFISDDGKVNVPIISPLKGIFDVGANYDVKDGLSGHDYKTIEDPSARSPENPWIPRVPFIDPGGKPDSEGLHPEKSDDRAQFLILKKTSNPPQEALSSRLRTETGLTFFAQDGGSYTTTVDNFAQLEIAYKAAHEYGYVVAVNDDSINKQNWPLTPQKLAIRLYQREIREGSLSLPQTVELLFKRQVRVGEIVTLKNGTKEWRPFMPIEDGQTVIYAVSIRGEVTLHPGFLPPEAAEADFVFVLNSERASRPGAGAAVVQGDWPSDKSDEVEPKKVEISPVYVRTHLPDEMLGSFLGPSGQRWTILPNKFAVFPPWLVYPDGVLPAHALVLTHAPEAGRPSYPQNNMHQPNNILDALAFSRELSELPQDEASEKILSESISGAMAQIFNAEKPDAYNLVIINDKTDDVVAINGYRPPGALPEVMGGASQNNGHIQAARVRTPLHHVPDSALTEVGTIPTEDGKEPIRVSVMNWNGQTALVFDHGGRRAFVFDRPNGKPKGFGNFWSFLELSRMIVIEAIPRFFNLTPQQTRELDQMPLAQDRLRWLRENLQTLLNQGVHKDLFADVNTAFSRNETSITASPEQMEKIGKETIAMMAMKRSELRGGAVKTFLYQAQVARDLLKEKGLGFVLGVILGINKEAAWLDLIAAKAVIRQMIDGLDAFVEAHKDRELNLGFMMAFDPQLKEEFVALAQKIQSLKQVPGNKINNKLEVIFTSEQTIENREAFEAIQRAGAKAKVKGKNRDFMLDSSVFAYGVEVPVGSDLKHLVVEAGVYSMRVVFPAALALNMHTAADGKIEADSLRVPQDLATVFGMAGRSLRILDGVLEAKWLEIAAQRIILSAA